MSPFFFRASDWTFRLNIQNNETTVRVRCSLPGAGGLYSLHWSSLFSCLWPATVLYLAGSGRKMACSQGAERCVQGMEDSDLVRPENPSAVCHLSGTSLSSQSCA